MRALTRQQASLLTLIVLSGCSGDTSSVPDTAQAPSAWSVTHREQRLVEGFPPSLVARIKRAEDMLAKRVGVTRPEARQGVRSVVRLSRRWRPGDVITVAFRGGSSEIRDSIAAAAQSWSQFANLRFDFWTDIARSAYRKWSAEDQQYVAHIRIGFDEEGLWSSIGSESIDPQYVPADSPSMNLQGFDRGLPWYWKETVLHEFGHALGLEHEHQNPLATCEAEFRWDDDPGYVPTQRNGREFVPDALGRHPGIYRRLGGPPNRWDTATIDYNLRQWPFSSDRDPDTFDAQSIMKYFFEDWMFRNGTQSTCYSPEPTNLSAGDQAAARKHYPPVAMAPPSTEKAVSDALGKLELPAATRDQVLNEVRRIANEQIKTTASIH